MYKGINATKTFEAIDCSGGQNRHRLSRLPTLNIEVFTQEWGLSSECKVPEYRQTNRLSKRCPLSLGSSFREVRGTKQRSDNLR